MPSLFQLQPVSTCCAEAACSKPIQLPEPGYSVTATQVWSARLLNGASLPPQLVQRDAAVGSVTAVPVPAMISHLAQHAPLHDTAVATPPAQLRPVGSHVAFIMV